MIIIEIFVEKAINSSHETMIDSFLVLNFY